MTNLTAEQEAELVKNYQAVDERGNYKYKVTEIAKLHGLELSGSAVSQIARANGVQRRAFVARPGRITYKHNGRGPDKTVFVAQQRFSAIDADRMWDNKDSTLWIRVGAVLALLKSDDRDLVLRKLVR